RQRCGDRPLDELATDHATARTAHDTAATAAADLDRRREDAAALDRLDADLQDRLRTIDTDLADTDRADAVAAAEADEIRARIHAAVGDEGSLTDRRARAAALVAAATDLLDRRAAASRARSHADERAGDAEHAATAAGFENL